MSSPDLHCQFLIAYSSLYTVGDQKLEVQRPGNEAMHAPRTPSTTSGNVANKTRLDSANFVSVVKMCRKWFKIVSVLACERTYPLDTAAVRHPFFTASSIHLQKTSPTHRLTNEEAETYVSVSDNSIMFTMLYISL